MGSTTGTFLKIKKSIVIEIDMVIEMGSNQFKVLDNRIDQVYLLITEGPDWERVVKCDLTQQNIKVLRLGRKSSNELSFQGDQHMSSVHA